jgi:hypothetical protein
LKDRPVARAAADVSVKKLVNLTVRAVYTNYYIARKTKKTIIRRANCGRHHNHHNKILKAASSAAVQLFTSHAYLLLGGVGVLGEQPAHGHDPPRRAVPTLAAVRLRNLVTGTIHTQFDATTRLAFENRQ